MSAVEGEVAKLAEKDAEHVAGKDAKHVAEKDAEHVAEKEGGGGSAGGGEKEKKEEEKKEEEKGGSAGGGSDNSVNDDGSSGGGGGDGCDLSERERTNIVKQISNGMVAQLCNASLNNPQLSEEIVEVLRKTINDIFEKQGSTGKEQLEDIILAAIEKSLNEMKGSSLLLYSITDDTNIPENQTNLDTYHKLINNLFNKASEDIGNVSNSANKMFIQSTFIQNTNTLLRNPLQLLNKPTKMSGGGRRTKRARKPVHSTIRRKRTPPRKTKSNRGFLGNNRTRRNMQRGGGGDADPDDVGTATSVTTPEIEELSLEEKQVRLKDYLTKMRTKEQSRQGLINKSVHSEIDEHKQNIENKNKAIQDHVDKLTTIHNELNNSESLTPDRKKELEQTKATLEEEKKKAQADVENSHRAIANQKGYLVPEKPTFTSQIQLRHLPHNNQRSFFEKKKQAMKDLHSNTMAAMKTEEEANRTLRKTTQDNYNKKYNDLVQKHGRINVMRGNIPPDESHDLDKAKAAENKALLEHNEHKEKMKTEEALHQASKSIINQQLNTINKTDPNSRANRARRALGLKPHTMVYKQDQTKKSEKGLSQTQHKMNRAATAVGNTVVHGASKLFHGVASAATLASKMAHSSHKHSGSSPGSGSGSSPGSGSGPMDPNMSPQAEEMLNNYKKDLITKLGDRLEETEEYLLQKITDVTYSHLNKNPTPIVISVTDQMPKALSNLHKNSVTILICDLLRSNRTIFDQSITDTFTQLRQADHNTSFSPGDPLFIDKFHEIFREKIKKYVLPK